MVPLMFFLVCLASQGGLVKSSNQTPPPPESRNADQSSPNPAMPEFIECASITQDEVFQNVFRNPDVLLPFLNEVLRNDFPNAAQLTMVEVRAIEQDLFSEGQYHIFLDVRARDTHGNAYVIEMERSCQVYDIIRFQYTAARVFVQLINNRYELLKNTARDEAVRKTNETKSKAKEAAKLKAVTENATSQEVVLAQENAEKAVTDARPKPIHNQDLFKASEVPAVIVIVIVEKGMPVRKYASKFPAEKYTMVSYFDELGPESKMCFVYIDLTKFSKTTKLEKPKTAFDYWCAFLWRAKEKRIEKEHLKNFQQFPGIQQALTLIGNLPLRKKGLIEAQQIKEETIKEEGRQEERLDVAKAMLKNEMDDATIIKLTKISQDELEELKLSLSN